MNSSSIPTLTKTRTPNADALTTAPHITPAQFGCTRFGRTFLCWWDKIAVAGLLVSCGVYGFYAITQMTGF